MASINRDQFYINMVPFNREEAAVTLALLLTACCWSDEDLQQLGQTIGVNGNIREMIETIGAKMDADWNEMLEMTKAALAELA